MAIDIFMCGDCNPQDSVEYLKEHVSIKDIDVQIIERGLGYYSSYK